MKLKKLFSEEFLFSPIGLFVISVFTYLFTILTLHSHMTSMVFVVFQDMVLLYFVLKNKIECFAGFYTIFMALSFETSAYLERSTESFYGFKNLSLGVSNSLIIMVVALFLIFLLNFKKIKLKKPETSMGKFFSFLVFINVFAILFGVLNLFLGDNGASFSSDYIGIYLDELYYGLFTLCNALVLLLSFHFSEDKKKTYSFFLNIIVAIMLAHCYVPYIAYLLGIRGGYGGSLVFTLAKFALPFLILIPGQFNRKHKIFIYVSWFVGIIIPMIFFGAGTGKEILFLGVSIILFFYFWLYKLIKRRTRWVIGLISIVGVVLLLVALKNLATHDTRLGDKANQLYSMICFWEPNWLENMPLSPQIRIYEFTSICEEYIKKPGYIFFGKGYGGSFQDHFNYFRDVSIIPVDKRAGAFSLFEFDNNYFFRVHETILRAPLCYGLIGVAGFLFWIFKFCRKLSFCSVLGILWLVFFFNTSQTLTVILIMGCFMALFEREKGGALK